MRNPPYDVVERPERETAGSASLLKLGLEGLHSARRGDYRVVYRIDRARRRVEVIAVEHRSDAYRSR